MSREGACWTVEELADALGDLPYEDPFDKFAASLGGALGAGGREQLERIMDVMLEETVGAGER